MLVRSSAISSAQLHLIYGALEKDYYEHLNEKDVTDISDRGSRK